MKEKQKKLTPLGDNCIIKRIPIPEQTSGGIYVPKHFRPTVPEYEVISVGPKVTDLKPGDVVFNKEYEGTAFELEGVAYIIVKENAIIAKKG